MGGGLDQEIVNGLVPLVTDTLAAVDGEHDEQVARRPDEAQAGHRQDQEHDDDRPEHEREGPLPSDEIHQRPVEVVHQDRQHGQARQPPGAGQLEPDSRRASETLPISRSTCGDRGTIPSKSASGLKPRADNPRSAGRPGRPRGWHSEQAGPPPAADRSPADRPGCTPASVNVAPSIFLLFFRNIRHQPSDHLLGRSSAFVLDLAGPRRRMAFDNAPDAALVQRAHGQLGRARSGGEQRLLPAVRGVLAGNLGDAVAWSLPAGISTWATAPTLRRLAQLALRPAEPVEQVGHHDRECRLQRQVALFPGRR